MCILQPGVHMHVACDTKCKVSLQESMFTEFYALLQISSRHP